MELVEIIVKALSDKKAKDIVKINVSGKTVIADYFIICDAPSVTQVRALCDHVEEEVEKRGTMVLRREGVSEGRWAVLDFGEVIVHVFNSESREFYRIERLWQDESNVEKIED
jgi:ribosome-associated protein